MSLDPRITEPVLFSKYFGVDQTALDKARLIDPFIDIDTELFIDPVLLEKSSFDVIKKNALATFKGHFEKFIRLLAISKNEFDPAWVAARRLLDLTEPPENGLGYGSTGRSGSSCPEVVRDALLRTSKQIIELGSKDPEMISLMGFFEENVGPDTISDFTTRVIMNELAEVTEAFCKRHQIPLHESALLDGHRLPRYVNSRGEPAEIVLVPQSRSKKIRFISKGLVWSSVGA